MNAKEEFIEHIENRVVKCATLSKGDYWNYADEVIPSYDLKVGHTEKDYKEFLKKIDYEYDDGFGGQNIKGAIIWYIKGAIIWYEDGTWSERDEYDGAEWWNYVSTPIIPESLNRVEL